MYIDISTRNKSFLATYKELRDLGISNCKFFLGLFDKSLVGVNPYDKNLSDIVKAKIVKECVKNPWYFIREVCRIPEQGSTEGCRFILHRGNLALLFCLMNSISVILELPRQNYKTMSAVAFFLWLYNFGTEGSNMMFMNKGVKDTKLNIKRVKDLYNLLPRWMDIRTDQDIDNIEYIESKTKKNRIDAIMPANSPDLADKAGRGMTVPLQWMDEYAFTKYNEIITMASAPAFSRASESALANGKPCFRLITTTPNNIDIPEGAHCKSIINDATIFTESMYDMSVPDLKDFINQNENNFFVYIKFTWDKLRRNKAWYIKECKNLLNNRLMISREIDLNWTLSQDNSPFDEDELARLRDFQRSEVLKFPIKENYPYEILIYDEKLADSFRRGELYPSKEITKCYAISVDVSGGLRRDSTVILFNDPDTLETVAEISSNIMPTDILEDILVEISATPQFKYAFFIIERNSYGLGIIQHLEKIEELRRKLFYTEYTMDNKQVRVKAVMSAKDDYKYKREYGINTDTATRPVMIANLSNLIRLRPEIFISANILQEIGTLVVTPKGKIEHARGAHDDHVMSKALFIFAYTEWQRVYRRFRNKNNNTVKKAVAMVSRYNKFEDYEKKKAYEKRLKEEYMANGMIEPEHIEHPNTEVGRIISLNSPNFQANEFNPLYRQKKISPEDYFSNKNQHEIKKFTGFDYGG